MDQGLPRSNAGLKAHTTAPWPPHAHAAAGRRLVDLVLDQLEAWGIQRVYGVAGDTVLPLISAMGERRAPVFIPTRHEEAAVFMAKAEAKLNGNLGVCVATAGPGVAHMINGLADALTDSAPVLALTGQLESFHVATSYKQVIDQQQLVGAVTQFTGELGHPAAILDVLGRAMRKALSHGKPAHVSIPKDFWEVPVEGAAVRSPEPYLKTPPRSTQDVILGALDLLHQSERPLIMAGIGARAAMGETLRFAERLRAPVVYTLAASGQAPRDHHLVVGGIGEGGTTAARNLMQEADCIVRLGTTWWPTAYVPPSPKVIDIDIRPEHIGMGTPAAYGIVGPAEEVLPLLTAHAPDRPRPEWEARAAFERSQSEEELSQELAASFEPQPGGVHPAAIIRSLQAHLPPSAVIALDVGDHVLWFNRHFRGNGRHDVLVSGYWRTMGIGLPAAIAAKLVQPERPALALVGDGGFGMVLGELLTAVHHGVAVTVVVFNNRSLAMEENEMEKLAMPVHGVRLHNPNFARYAELCGAAGFRVEHPAALDQAMAGALAAGRPAVVDVVTSPLRVPSPAPRPWAELVPQR